MKKIIFWNNCLLNFTLKLDYVYFFTYIWWKAFTIWSSIVCVWQRLAVIGWSRSWYGETGRTRKRRWRIWSLPQTDDACLQISTKPTGIMPSLSLLLLFLKFLMSQLMKIPGANSIWLKANTGTVGSLF